MVERLLTAGETALVQSVFGGAVDCSKVRMIRRKWWLLQPADTIMTPCGNLHFNPKGSAWSDDFSKESLPMQLLPQELRASYFSAFARCLG